MNFIKNKRSIKTRIIRQRTKILESIEPNEIISIDHLSEDDWKRFTEIFTYNTNAIEGSKVNQKKLKTY